MMNIFNRHGGVIHENADGQREAAEGHEVDGFAEGAQGGDGTEHRERNGKGNDERAAPGTEEQQNHQGGEGGGNDALAQDTADGGAHKHGLIGKFLDVEVGRDGVHHARQGFFDTGHDVERGGGAGFHDGEQGAAHAVLAHGILLGRIAIVHLGDIVEIDGRAIDHLDGQVVHFVNEAGIGIHHHAVFGAAHFGGAAGEDEVLCADGIHDILRDEVFGLERGEI